MKYIFKFSRSYKSLIPNSSTFNHWLPINQRFKYDWFFLDKGSLTNFVTKILALSDFKQINFCSPLKSSSHRFSVDFRENWSWLIYLNSFKVRSKIWRRFLNCHPLPPMRFLLPTAVVRGPGEAKNSDKNRTTFPDLPCFYFMHSTFVIRVTKIDLPTTTRAEIFLTLISPLTQKNIRVFI